MKRSFYLTAVSAFFFLLLSSCEEKRTNVITSNSDTIEMSLPDTTIYGVCSAATTMHMLSLVTDDGREMAFLVNTDDNDENIVMGGMFTGDRMAVTSAKIDGDSVATKIINLNTLQGRWTSIDRNFEILHGGDVISAVKSETNPYTLWKIHNGQLILNRDTFDIITLGADTLEIENDKGIFVYIRK